MPDITLFWHDYETWGLDPRADRPSQFAGIRTNVDLEIIDEPVMLFCRPAGDFLPHPDSVMITGLTPQRAAQEGVIEAEFFKRIHEQLAKPGTCGVGYNSLRFDDEVTRFGFYRNFIDPYAREWQHGNSRWDIIDLVRMTHALRPDGINWPQREDGLVSFRLEDLTAENGIAHVGAHDALADVRATIDLARLIRDKQPKLYDFYFSLRDKNQVAQYLDLREHTPVLHISGMYPAEFGRIAPVMPLVRHPRNKNEIIVADLRSDPGQLLAMSAEQIGQNLFTPAADLPEGSQRVGLKTVHINKSPALAPLSTLDGTAARRWQIDLNQIRKHRDSLLADRGLVKRVQKVFEDRQPMPAADADTALYGGFIRDADRRQCNRILQATPDQLVGMQPDFEDARLQELFTRYLGRNWPERLDDEALQGWRRFCEARLVEGDFGSTLTLAAFQQRMQELAAEQLSDEQRSLLEALDQWVMQEAA